MDWSAAAKVVEDAMPPGEAPALNPLCHLQQEAPGRGQL